MDSETKAQARRWLAEVDAAHDDGGYAAGDCPAAPVEEVRALLAEVDRLRDGITKMVDAWWREPEPISYVAFMLANLRDNREAPNLHDFLSDQPPRPVG